LRKISCRISPLFLFPSQNIEITGFFQPPELAHVLDWMGSQKARCPEILPSRREEAVEDAKLVREGNITGSSSILDDNEDEDHEGPWDRGFVKSQSLKSSIKSLKKKLPGTDEIAIV